MFHDDTPWWVWSAIWLAFGIILLAGSFAVEAKFDIHDNKTYRQMPGIAALMVALIIPLASLLKDPIDPFSQVFIWLGICIVPAFLLYLRGYGFM